LTAADWALELSDTTLLVNARAGLSSFTAGPGTNYDQYRDTFDYRAWTEGRIDRGTLHAAAE